MATSRLFKEIGDATDRMNASLKALVTTAEKAGTGIEKVEASGRVFLDTIQKTIRPADELNQKLVLLEKAGVNYRDTVRLMGDQAIRAADAQRQFGGTVPKLVAEMEAFAKSAQASKFSFEGLGKSIQDFAAHPLEAAKAGMVSLLATLGPTTVGIGAMAAAGVAAVEGIGQLAEHLSDNAIELRNHAAAAGMTTQNYQALQRVGVETGVGMESLARMIGMLDRQMATGTKLDFVAVLNALRQSAGEGAADISKGLIPLLDDLGKRLAAIHDPGLKAELMNAAFNRRLQEMGILATITAGNLQELTEAVKRSGAAWGEDTQQNLIRIHDNLAETGREWQALKFKAVDYFATIAKYATASLPAIINLLDPFKDYEWLMKGIRELQPLAPLRPMPAHQVNAPLPQEGPPVPSERNVLAWQKEQLELAKLIHDGITQNRDLLLQLAEAQAKYEEAVAQKDVVSAQRWGKEYDRIKKTVEAIKELPKVWEQYQRAMREVRDIGAFRVDERVEGLFPSALPAQITLPGLGVTVPTQWTIPTDEISRKGRAALMPSESEVDSAIKTFVNKWKAALGELDTVERQIGRYMTQSKLEELKYQQQIVATVIPLNEREREQIEIQKVHLEFAIRAEETRTKYAQMRAELEDKISKLPYSTLRTKALDDLAKLGPAMNAELERLSALELAETVKVHRQEYLRMVDTVKDGAGKVFDAIAARGKGAFTNLMDWIEGVFLTRLRVMFQNLMSILFLRNETGQSFFARLMEGVLPRFMQQPAGLAAAAAAGAFSVPGFGMSIPAGGLGAAGVSQMFQGLGITGGPLTLAQIQALSQFGRMSQLPAYASIGAAGTMGLSGIAGMLLPAGMGAFLGSQFPGNAYVKGAAATGLGLAGLAGGVAMATGAPLSMMLGSMFTNPWTAVIGGGVMGTIALIKAIQGKNAWTAGAPEAMRDFGVNLSPQQFQQFATGIGLSESQTYGIRKPLESSPLFLTQVLWPLAQAQGRTQEFLTKLEKVATAPGQVTNFRQAFELGNATGDWSKLNQQFVDAFKNCSALSAIIPDFASKLAAAGTAGKSAFEIAAEPIKNLISSINDSIKPLETMYDKFLNAGEITEDLRKKVTELGGDLAKFEAASKLIQINSEWETLVKHFWDTGEILPRLGELFTQFGGDLASFTANAAQLETLKESLGGINDLMSGLQGLLDSPIRDVLSGKWTAATAAGLQALNIDPSKLMGVSNLIGWESGWDKAVQDFFTGMKYTWSESMKRYVQVPLGLVPGGTIEQAIRQYGGQAGLTALDNYAKGFNTITPALLQSVKTAMDADYQAKIKSALDYLGTLQRTTNDKITALTTKITDQLRVVQNAIVDALNTAKSEVVTELQKMLVELQRISGSTSPAGTTTAPEENPGGSTFPNNQSGGDTVPGAGQQGVTVVNHYHNPIITGASSLADLTHRGLVELKRRGINILNPGY